MYIHEVYGACVCVCVYLCVCAYVHVCVCMYIYKVYGAACNKCDSIDLNVFCHTHTLTHTHTHSLSLSLAHTHTHTHTHTHHTCNKCECVIQGGEDP